MLVDELQKKIFFLIDLKNRRWKYGYVGPFVCGNPKEFVGLETQYF